MQRVVEIPIHNVISRFIFFFFVDQISIEFGGGTIP